jgi:hypothetical protein
MKTSAPNSKKNKSANTPSANAEMTREQALAVAWEALAVLAKMGQLTIFNDVSKGRAWFGIANAKVMKSPGGKIRLVDLTKSANAEPGVGTDQKPLTNGEKK